MKITRIKDFSQEITCVMGVVNSVDDNSRGAILEIVNLNDLVLPNGDNRVVQTGRMIQARKDEMLIIRPSAVASNNNINIAEHEIFPGERVKLVLHMTNIGMSQAEIPAKALLAEIFSVAVTQAKADSKKEEEKDDKTN